jgi:outer membrane lipoprotein SlyB
MKSILISIAALVFLSGCATRGVNFVPIIDQAEQAKVDQDLKDCREYALQVPSAKQGAAKGAASGAMLAWAINTAIGADAVTYAITLVGALQGGISGSRDEQINQESIIRNCMFGRDHKVLN